MSTPLEHYRQMAVIRAVEDRALELSREGLFAGSVHTCHGHEAVAVGMASQRRPADKIIATYRGHGWALAAGVPVVEVLAEICQRAGGVNGGRNGSLMITAPERGFVGENSIVGAGYPIAGGVGLAAHLLETGGVAVAAAGDGAMSQGALHEGLAMAAARNLPVVFVCENNGWAEMTPTAETVRDTRLARRAEAYGIPARTVDGLDLAAVVDAADWAFSEARSGRGPVFVEFDVVRLSGHYNKDIQHYRSKDDLAAAAAADPLVRLRAHLLDSAAALPQELDDVDRSVQAEIDAATDAVRAMPGPEVDDPAQYLYAPAAPVQVSTRAADQGSSMEYWRAINTALVKEADERPELVVFGEDVARAGGVFGVTRGLQKKYGEERVFDTPIAESAILGCAVGSAMSGLRPVVEIMWADFLMVAMDQLVNQAANVRFSSQGKQTAPITVRTQQGATPGSCAQHTQSLEALLTHVPGLRVGMPATPADAYAMTRTAIADPDPVVLIESRELYQLKGDVAVDAAVQPVGGARRYGEGGDVVVITWGAMVQRALAARDTLSEEGLRIDVVDVRWLAPLDIPTIAAAVRSAGGRAVIAHEAVRTGGFGAEIIAQLHERLGAELPLQLTRLTTPDVRLPTPGHLQEAIIPGSQAIAATCRTVIDRAAATV